MKEVRKIEGERKMKLHVENFAKIREADIEINGITVIAGENSTGKSTISKLLYCLFETFYNYEDRIYRQKTSAIKQRIDRMADSIISEDGEINLDVFEFRNETSKLISQEIISKFNTNVQHEEFRDLVKSVFQKYEIYPDIPDQLLKQIFNILSTEKQKEVEALLNSSLNIEFENEYCPLSNLEDVKVKLIIKDGNISFDITNSQRIIDVPEYRSLSSEVIYYDDPFVIDDITGTKSKRLLFSRFFNFGDGRISTHLDKMEKILERSSSKDKSNLYNQIISNELVHSIEKEIKSAISGDFINEDDDLKFKENNLDKSMCIKNLSSGVKSFAILLKLIRDFKIEENGTLILDEPEVHLHPKWQVQYAELLVLLQKALNLHILISSHSPYFINAIEVYSAKHKIADKCKYYLSDLDEDNRAYFEDVTTNTEKIYKKLAEPLRLLNDLKYGNR